MLQKTLLLLSITILTVHSYCQPYISHFDRNVYDGSKQNWSIFRASNGYVYVCNHNGLLEYDGIHWQLHRTEELEIHRSIAVDSLQRIFVGGYQEFGFWHKNNVGQLCYTSLSQKHKNLFYKDEEIWRIFIVEQGVLFQSFSGIFLYDYQTVRRIVDNGFILLLNHVSGKYYIQGLKGQLCELKDEKLVALPGTSIFNTMSIPVILPFNKTTLLIATSLHGLFLYENGSVKPFPNLSTNLLLQKAEINCGAILSNGDYLLGTISNGIYQINPKGEIIRHFDAQNGLGDNTVLSIHIDREEKIGVALDKGITFINYQAPLRYYPDIDNNIGPLYTAAIFEKSLYIGTNKGVYKLPYPLDSIQNPIKQAVFIEGTQGQIWDMQVIGDRLMIGHNKGLYSIKSGNVERLFTQNGVYCITPTENDSRFFVGSYFKPALFVKHQAQWQFHQFLDIPCTSIRQIEKDYLGYLWLETARNEIYSILPPQQNTQNSYKHHQLVTFSDTIKNFKLCKLGKRIILFNNNRFYAYDDLKEELVPFSKLNNLGVVFKNIRKIIPSNEEHLFWVIGKNDVTQLYYNEDTTYIKSYINLKSLKLFLVEGYENAVVLDKNNLLVCLDNSFLLYNTLKEIASKGRLHIKEIYTENIDKTEKKHLAPASKPSIDIAHNNLTFTFASDNYNPFSYQYKLKGLSETWHFLPENGKLTFFSLPSGKYTLLVMQKNKVQTIFRYNFYILPHWYNSYIAYIIYILCIILTFFILLRFLILRQQKKYQEEIDELMKNQLILENQTLTESVKRKERELVSLSLLSLKRTEILNRIKAEILSGKKFKIEPSQRDKVLNLLDSDVNTEEDWRYFLIQFEESQQNFFTHLKNKYPQLSHNELKLAACLKHNLNTKDIAALLNISPRGVEIARYRLRKKLNLQSGDNLNEFFLLFNPS